MIKIIVLLIIISAYVLFNKAYDLLVTNSLYLNQMQINSAVVFIETKYYQYIKYAVFVIVALLIVSIIYDAYKKYKTKGENNDEN